MGRFKKYLTQAAREGVFPGCVLLVSQQERMISLEWTGLLAHRPGAAGMKQDTIFDLASLTKPLATTLAMMKLIDEHRIELDQPLPELLPGVVPEEKTCITPRLLLCHSAGFMDYQMFYLALERVKAEDRKTLLRDLILKNSLAYEPGKKVLYSDLGFMLLEWIIEQRAGMPLPRFLEDRIYGPLGFRRTFLNEDISVARFSANHFAATEDCPWRKRVMQGETHDENAYAAGGYSGHAGLFGVAEEIHRLVDLLREHYHGRRSDYFKPETVRDFFTRQNIIGDSTWALGWDTPSILNSSAGRFFSQQSVGHLGFTGTSVWMDLEREVIVILLTNRVHPSRKNERIREFRPKLHENVMQSLGFHTPR